MRTLSILLVLVCLLSLAFHSHAATVTVPGDYTTIQGAIDAMPGNQDTILVAPDTYYENINFYGKALLIRSDADGNEATLDFDPYNTVIDGNQTGSVAVFASGEGADSILQGFMLTNGAGTKMGAARYGGGVFCAYDAQPLIKHCIIADNKGVIEEDDEELIDLGGGVFCGFGLSSDPEQWTHPKLINTVIFRNQSFGSTYGHGGGIACWHKAKVELINCTMYNNQANDVFGQGGGFWCYDQTEVHAANTIVFDNKAAIANQVWVGTSSNPSSVLIEYSIVGKTSGTSGDLTYVESNCTYDTTEVVTANPNMKNPGAFDFGLTTKSTACMSKGENSFLAAYNLEWDINNTDRTMIGVNNKGTMDPGTENQVDIGADEYRPFYVPQIFDTIADAVADASSSVAETICVAPGTYYEHLDFDGRPVILKSDADGDKNTDDQVPGQTILDGTQNGRVVMIRGSSGTLTGFTVTNGSATRGGGIFCAENSNAKLYNCIITDNHASEYGGGIYITSDSKLVSKIQNGKTCTIENNTAGIGGGGLYISEVKGAESEFLDCVFANNSAGDHAGGVGTYNGRLTLKWTHIHDNTAPRGGGVYMYGKGNNSSTIILCDIYNNGNPGSFDIQEGGGILLEADCDVRLYRNEIYWNHAVRGGGLYIDGCKPDQLNTLSFYQNTADYGGGFYYINSNKPVISNTLYDNHANVAGGGYYLSNCDSNVEIGNTIFWENTAPTGAAIHFEDIVHTVAYCNISNGSSYSWFEEMNSLALDPRWVDQTDPQSDLFLRLDSDSPCINMGLNAYGGAKDIDDVTRPVIGTEDIGADEFAASVGPQELTAGKDGDPLSNLAYKIYVYPSTYYPLEFYINASSENAGRDYFLLASLTSRAPGLQGLPGGEFLPLYWDYMTNLTVGAAISGSPIFQDFGGKLDANGKATAFMHHQGLLDENMIDIEIHFAYTLRGGGKPSWNFASHPISITIKKED